MSLIYFLHPQLSQRSSGIHTVSLYTGTGMEVTAKINEGKTAQFSQDFHGMFSKRRRALFHSII